MSGALSVVRKDGLVTIAIDGFFDAYLVNDFHRAYKPLEPEDRKIIVDLEYTESLDSAALGMLIHMHKNLEETRIGKVRIINCNEKVRKVFRIMQFERLFSIESV